MNPLLSNDFDSQTRTGASQALNLRSKLNDSISLSRVNAKRTTLDEFFGRHRAVHASSLRLPGFQSEVSSIEEALASNARVIVAIEKRVDKDFRQAGSTMCDEETKIGRCRRNVHSDCSKCVIHCRHRDQFLGALNHMKIAYANEEWTNVKMAADDVFSRFYAELNDRVAYQEREALRLERRELLRVRNAQCGREDKELRTKRTEAIREQKNARKLVSKLRRKEDLKRSDWPDTYEDFEQVNAQCGNTGTAQGLLDFKVEHIIKIPMIESFLTMCSDRNKNVDFQYVVKEFALACVHVYQANFSFASISTSVLHFLSNVKAGTALIELVMRSVNKVFNPNAQAPMEDLQPSMIVAGLFGMISLVIVGLTVNTLPSEKSVDTFLMKMTRLGSTLTCMDKIQDKVRPMMEAALDYVRVNWFGYTAEDLDEWKLYNEWCDEVKAIRTVDFEKKIKTDVKLKAQIDTLLMRGDEILRRLDTLRVPMVQRTRFMQCHMFLMRARTEAASSSAGMHIPRVPPVLFHFVGASGVGKSEMTHRLNARLLAASGVTDPKALHSMIYFRTPGQERFDGFRTEMLGVVCDDFGSMKDSAARPSGEPQEAIRMQNSAVWPLDMAHLSDKGNIFFRAKWVIWTSNRAHFNFDSVTNPEAILRRVTHKFIHRPHPDYAVERVFGKEKFITLDEAKVDQEAKTDKTVYTRCWQFDLVDGQKAGEIILAANLTFDQVCDMCVGSLNRKQDLGGKKLDDLEEYFKECIRKEQGKAQGLSDWIPSFPKQEDEDQHMRTDWCMKDEFIQDVPEVRDWPGFDYGHIREASCIKSKMPVRRWPGVKDRLARGFATATAWAAVSPNSDEEFNRVFWEMTQIHPNKIEPCTEHFEPEWWRKFKNFKERAHNMFERMWQKCVPTWIQNNFEEMCRWLMCFAFGAVISYLTNIIATKVVNYGIRKIWSRESMLDYFTQRFGPEDANWLVYEFYQYESAQDKTSGAQRKNIESHQDRTNGPSRKNIESMQERTMGVQRRNVESNIGMAEAVTDQNAHEIARKVERNTYQVCAWKDGEWRKRGNLVFIGGRVAMTNRHIVKAFGDQKIRLENDNFRTGAEFPIDSLNIAFLEDQDQKDVALVEFPRSMMLHADLRKFFMTREDFCHHNELRKMMMLATNERGVVQRSVTNLVRANDRAVFTLNDGKELRYVRDWYEYGLETVAGDCGAALIAFDSAFERKIFGIHMAGRDVCGRYVVDYTAIGCAVHRETLDRLISRLTLRWPESLENGEVPQPYGIAQGVRAFDGDFIYLGDVSMVSGSHETQIKPSPVHGMITEPTTKPAHLKPFWKDGQKVDPLEIARKKASTATINVDRKLADSCKEHFKQTLLRRVYRGDQRVLTFEEAIAGIEGDPLYQGIKRNTSPGYGWAKGGGKRTYLGDDEYKFDHPEVLARYKDMLERVKNGERTGCIWTDTLKDERRPIAKVDAGKTRLFAASEMTYVILFRQYFMGFAAHVARNKIDVESCVGINVYSQDWSRLARKMMEVGKHVIAGDFSNYDGTLCGDLLWDCLDLAEEFYQGTPEEKQIRRMLWMDIVHSVHVSGRTVYQWTHSQPSGCPITAILNSIYHSLAARYVYVKCARKYCPEKAALSNFTRYVRHANYGDDDVYNVSDEIIDWYNQETMTEMFKDLGMEYTDEAKTGNIVKSRRLDEIMFLKRKFRYDDEQCRYRAPLSLDTIREMPMWVKRNKNHWELTAETLQDAMLELAQHSRAVFDAEKPPFEKARQYVNVRFPCVFDSFDQYQEVEYVKYCME